MRGFMPAVLAALNGDEKVTLRASSGTEEDPAYHVRHATSWSVGISGDGGIGAVEVIDTAGGDTLSRRIAPP